MDGGTHTLLTLALLWVAVVPLPGPNILFFAATVVSSGRKAAVAAGCGIVLGTGAWGLAGLFGLFWLFEVFPALGVAVKLAGAAYLIFIGFRILRANGRRRHPQRDAVPVPRRPISARRAFIVGLLTNLSNPKTLVFVTSLFAVTHLAHEPLPIGLAGVAIMVAISGSFYVLLGGLLTLMPRAGETRLGRVFGLGIGALMMAFGVRLAVAP